MKCRYHAHLRLSCFVGADSGENYIDIFRYFDGYAAVESVLRHHGIMSGQWFLRSPFIA